jgi:isopenicillin-N N-acyltransferase like protein
VRGDLSQVVLHGDPLEVAYQLGRYRRKKIERRIEHWEKQLRRIYRGRQGERRAKEKAFLERSQSYVAPLLEEIHAMAEGAGVSFSELFRLNLTELGYYVDKCTDLIWPVQHQGKRGILIAHNEDWNPRRNDVFHLKVQLPEVSYQVLAYDGYLPGLSAGMNSHGLIHSVNFLLPKDLRLGVPRIFLARYLVTARGIDDFLNFLKKIPRAFGQAIHLAQGLRYLGLELTARKIARLQPGLPTVHANHYLAKQLRNRQPKPSPSSHFRQGFAEQLMLGNLQNKTGRDLSLVAARKISRRILSDRSGSPFALWRVPNGREETSATLATVLTDSLTLSFVPYRNPLEFR